MPPRVTYWTGTWDPAREGHSVEIQHLRREIAGRSFVVSFARGQRSDLWPRHGVFRVAGGRWAAYRALQLALEPWGQITHLFGAADSWTVARVLGRRPLLFTVTLHGELLPLDCYQRVAYFAVESERLGAMFRRSGIEPERIRVIHPGVDLERFVPSPAPPGGPFRLVFASSPREVSELESRGVGLLVETARLLPDIEIRCHWRTWDDEAAMSAALARLDAPANFCVLRGDLGDPRNLYRDAHATITAFRKGGGKECPNSVIEGLACGRPAILSEECGIAALVAGAVAGCCVSCDAFSLASAVEELRRRYPEFSRAAREMAEREFGLGRFLRTYRDLYAELATWPA